MMVNFIVSLIPVIVKIISAKLESGNNLVCFEVINSVKTFSGKVPFFVHMVARRGMQH